MLLAEDFVRIGRSAGEHREVNVGVNRPSPLGTPRADKNWGTPNRHAEVRATLHADRDPHRGRGECRAHSARVEATRWSIVKRCGYRPPNTTATGTPGTEALPVESVFAGGSGCSPPFSSTHPAITTRL